MVFREGSFEKVRVPGTIVAGVSVVVALVIACAALAAESRSESSKSASVGNRIGISAAPLSDVLAAPIRWFGSIGNNFTGYFFAVSENRRLKARITELEQVRDQAAILKAKNTSYEALLRITPDPPLAMVAGRSISEARGPFKNARLLNVGREKGVQIGNPVLSNHGLVGRISGTGNQYSRMILLTDVSSKIPVLIERTDARALLTGDGSGSPRLEFVRGVGSVQVGDRILSSGDGGGFPRGVPVGVVAKGLDGSWRVKLFSDRGPIDYVRVMLFEDFSQLVGPHDLDAPPLSGLAPVPVPDSAPTVAAPTAATPTPAPATPPPTTGAPG